MNYKLSQLPVAATVADDDMIYIVQGGTSKQVSLGALREQADGWQRTSDWLAMPVTATNTINILVAVYDTDSNFVALQCNTSSGTYHVDWGDGTNADFASGTPAEHVYTFGSLSGSWSTRGYNQALIEVSGAITTIDLGVRHSSVSVNYTQPFLDLQINCPSCVSLAIRSTVVPYSLERCDIVAIGSITTTSGMFNSCYSLVTVSFPVGSLGSVTKSYLYKAGRSILMNLAELVIYHTKMLLIVRLVTFSPVLTGNYETRLPDSCHYEGKRSPPTIYPQTNTQNRQRLHKRPNTYWVTFSLHNTVRD